MGEKITWIELRRTIVARSGASQKEVSTFMDELMQQILSGLRTDKIVRISGLGTFKLLSVAARKSVNVATGEAIVIPGYEKVSFAPEAGVKELFLNLREASEEEAPKESATPLQKLGAQANEIVGLLADLGQTPNKAEEPESVEEPEQPAEEEKTTEENNMEEKKMEEEKPIAQEPVIAPVTFVDPVTPVEPVKPIEPVAPVAPVAPVTPVAPVAPVTPQPVAPVTPVTPVTSVTPVTPIVAPVTPVVAPVTPVEPVAPVTPVEPIIPNTATTFPTYTPPTPEPEKKDDYWEPEKPKRHFLRDTLITLLILLLLLAGAFFFFRKQLTNWVNTIREKTGTEQVEKQKPEVVPTDTTAVVQAAEEQKPAVEEQKPVVKEPKTVIEQQPVAEKPVPPEKPAPEKKKQQAAEKEMLTEIIVLNGETLEQLAQRYYGNSDLWVFIYEANMNSLDDPDNVSEGTILQIPNLTDEQKNVNNPKTKEKIRELQMIFSMYKED